jgi:hypothetical protein
VIKLKTITQEDIDALKLENKRNILAGIGQQNLIKLFQNQPKFKPVEPKKLALDQQVAITLSENEKERLINDRDKIQELGKLPSISSYIRKKIVLPLDIEEWRGLAEQGLKDLNNSDTESKSLSKQKLKLINAIDLLDDITNVDKDVQEVEKLRQELQQVEERLSLLKSTKQEKRIYKLTGNITFNEANFVRWRAARLSIPVADFIRFTLFDYQPTIDDNHMSVDARKRFYISILDVCDNGWGKPPVVNECPNCARYLADIKRLQQQIEYLQKELERR